MKRGSSALLTIRRGHEVISVHSPDYAERILFGSSGTPNPGDDHGLLACASDAAKQCLELLCRSFPLEDRATSNFGTALRVKAVRSRLASLSIRKIPLIKILEYLRSAADAHRHLTCELMRDAVSILSAELRQTDSDAECAHNDGDMAPPVLDHDPWAAAALPPSAKVWRPSAAALWSNWRPSVRSATGDTTDVDELALRSDGVSCAAASDSVPVQEEQTSGLSGNSQTSRCSSRSNISDGSIKHSHTPTSAEQHELGSDKSDGTPSLESLVAKVQHFASTQKWKWTDRARTRLLKQYLLDIGFAKPLDTTDELSVFRVDPWRALLDSAIRTVDCSQ